jgi:hypothetical protein
MESVLLDVGGNRRAPATMPGRLLASASRIEGTAWRLLTRGHVL